MLFEDSLWSYEGSDRYDKLSERSAELTQQREAELKQTRGVFYIESKSLTELQIPGTFLFKFNGCTGDQQINAADISVVSDKESVLLTKFVGETREIPPGVCNVLETQIRANDPNSIKIVIPSLDVEIPAKIVESKDKMETMKISSPRKQMQNGIAAQDVVCKSGLALMIRSSGDAACVTPSTAEKLANAGWGVIEKGATMMEETEHEGLSYEEAKMISEDAYIFGFSLVMMELTKFKMSNVAEAGPANAPINQFFHYPAFPPADFRDVVRPNADTLYSFAWLDLSDEPLVLHLPDTDDRYFLFPIMDGYSNVFTSPGKRTTGTGEQDYVITGPFWSGTIPEGLTEIESPTNMAWVAGRTQTNTPSDYENVNNIQKQVTLTPLSSFGKDYQPPKNVPVNPGVDMKTPPVEKILQTDPDTYYNVMANLMKDNPPTPEDAEMVKSFSKIGLVPGEQFDMENLDPKLVMAIEEGFKSGQQKVLDNVPKMAAIENGWMVLPDSLARFGTDYLFRASVAYMGLGANWVDDAVYPIGFFDNNGDTFNGANKYVLHFPEGQTPPVNAFWSLTLYQDLFFYANSIDRYALGDRDDLEFNEDGSLDIYIQHESPEGKESNWLPSPEGDFDFIMRLYWPQEAVFDGTWQMPPVKKVE
jgi:hypothetical protein